MVQENSFIVVFPTVHVIVTAVFFGITPECPFVTKVEIFLSTINMLAVDFFVAVAGYSNVLWLVILMLVQGGDRNKTSNICLCKHSYCPA